MRVLRNRVKLIPFHQLIKRRSWYVPRGRKSWKKRGGLCDAENNSKTVKDSRKNLSCHVTITASLLICMPPSRWEPHKIRKRILIVSVSFILEGFFWNLGWQPRRIAHMSQSSCSKRCSISFCFPTQDHPFSIKFGMYIVVIAYMGFVLVTLSYCAQNRAV